MNLLTVSEASKVLRIAEGTLYRWGIQGRVPRLKVGGKVLYDKEALERWARSKALGAETSSRSLKTSRIESSQRHF